MGNAPIIKPRKFGTVRFNAFVKETLGPKLSFALLNEVVEWLGAPYSDDSIHTVFRAEPWIVEKFCATHQDAGVGLSSFAILLVVLHIDPPASTDLKGRASDMLMKWFQDTRNSWG